MSRDDAFIAALDTIKNVRDQMVDELESIDVQDWIDMLEEAIGYLVKSDSSSVYVKESEINNGT